MDFFQLTKIDFLKLIYSIKNTATCPSLLQTSLRGVEICWFSRCFGEMSLTRNHTPSSPRIESKKIWRFFQLPNPLSILSNQWMISKPLNSSPLQIIPLNYPPPLLVCLLTQHNSLRSMFQNEFYFVIRH